MVTLMFLVTLLGVLIRISLWVSRVIVGAYLIFLLVTLFVKFILHKTIGKVYKTFLIIGTVVAVGALLLYGGINLLLWIC